MSPLHTIRALRPTLRALVLTVLALALPALAAPASIPAHRKADSIVVITIRGEIDGWTARSVERRLKAAEDAGAGAVVIELDTPGGEVGAVLRITNALKSSSIPNTVAWIHRDAYSGGAIIALACREIVTADPAAMGDAFAVTPTINRDQGRTGLRGLSRDERTKILPVLLSDVTDSARRGGYDEFLVQAMVVDGVELWLVEDAATGRRYAINEAEYRTLFETDPPRGKPIVAGVTGARYEATDQGPRPTTDDAPPAIEPPADPTSTNPASAGTVPTASADEGDRSFQPASPALRDVAEEFDSDARKLDLEIASPTQRPTFSEADRGNYTLVAYLTDGTAAVVLRSDQLLALGFASATVQNDEQLKAYFGATSLTRLEQSWAESVAAFLTHPIVRGVLIVVFILALFVEMMSPGLVAPATVALFALVALLAPPMLVGLAGWWEIAAIVAGLALLGLEIFVLPGFGLFGVAGLVSLFAGLVGTFIPDSSGIPGAPGASGDLVWGATTVLTALIVSAIGIGLLMKHFGSLPVLNRLVLTSARPSDDADGDDLISAMNPDPRGALRRGATGVAATPLRPSGRADIDGTLHDVVADLGFIDAGRPVRVVAVEGLRIVVTDAGDPDSHATPAPTEGPAA